MDDAIRPDMEAPQPRIVTDRSVQLRGSSLALAVLRTFGWRLRFEGLPARQGVIVVYPHTSNWDFPVGLLAKWAMGMPANFWGKDSLFRVPIFGRWMRWLGGIPVDRSAPGGLVGQTVEHLRGAAAQGRFAWLALAPEGTRGLTDGWRSGFYRVAVQAQVPLCVAALDFGRREVRVNTFLQLCGDPALDMAAIEAALQQPRGCNPSQASPIRLS